MDLARLHPASLFLVWITVATALVERPTNVTLYCHNFTNSLKWEYIPLKPGIKFRVDIFAYSQDAQQLWVEPPSLEADLPFFPNPRDEFLVTVTAVMGEKESEPSPSKDGITFTYLKESFVEQKCSVDLLSVSVTAQPHDQVHFRFEHPWLTYKQKLHGTGKSKLRKRKSHEPQTNERLPVFVYEAGLINQTMPPHPYECEDSVCEGTMHVDATTTEHCLKITGELEQMSVISKDYCALPFLKPPPYSRHDYIYIIVSILALISLAAIGFMVYRKHTRPTSAPELKSTNFSGPRPELIWKADPVNTDNLQEVAPASPTPLLTPTVEQDERGFTTDYDLRLHIGVLDEDEGVSEGMDRGEPNDEGSAYMPGKDLDVDDVDVGRSDYERRPVPVKLAPDEIAEGYRG